MARDDKLIYEKPVAVPLGGVEKALGGTHCKSGTVPGTGGGEKDCGSGTIASSQNQVACYTGGSATTGGPGTACIDGTDPQPQ
jgi:hypothetical protein